ncbi:MAG: disulfide bond formation protein B [Paracoccaceae bacterium]
MTVYGRILLAGSGSAVLLIGALAFQYLGGLAPCPLCLWQRWPHVAALVIAGLAVTVLWRMRRPLSVLGCTAMAVGVGLGAYHVGVEQGWWPGPGTCSAPVPSAGTPSEFFDQLMVTPMVRCDEVVWSLLGLSMAGWNAVLSAALAAAWFWSAYAPWYEPEQAVD